MIEVHKSFDAVIDEWDYLADATQSPPSLYPDFISAWVSACAPSARLRIIALRENGSLEAVLPLVVRRGRLEGAALEVSNEGGLIAREPAQAIELARAALGVTLRGLRIGPLEREGPAATAIQAAATRTGTDLRVEPVGRRAVVGTDGDWEAYWEQAGKPIRREMRDQRRALSERGRVTIDVVASADRIGGARHELERLVERWGTADPERGAEHRGFVERVADWAADRGFLEVSFLRVDGLPVAAQRRLAAHGVRYVLTTTADPEIGELEPGRMLLAHELERAFGDATTRFELLNEPPERRFRWATSIRELVELRAFAPGPVGRMDRLVRRGAVRELEPLAPDPRPGAASRSGPPARDDG